MYDNVSGKNYISNTSPTPSGYIQKESSCQIIRKCYRI